MGVGAENDIYFVTKVVSQGDFFAGGLGVNVQNSQIVVSLFCKENFPAGLKGAGQGQIFHADSAHHIQNQNVFSVVGQDAGAFSGILSRIIAGAQKGGRFVQHPVNTALAKGMIASGDDISPGFKKQLGVLLGNAVSAAH